MDNKELNTLKEQIKAELFREITGKGYAPQKYDLDLNKARKKINEKLDEEFGTFHAYRVWEFIRRLSCYAAGEIYMRDLSHEQGKKAAEFAEKLCDMVIEERKKNSKEEEK